MFLEQPRIVLCCLVNVRVYLERSILVLECHLMCIMVFRLCVMILLSVVLYLLVWLLVGHPVLYCNTLGLFVGWLSFCSGMRNVFLKGFVLFDFLFLVIYWSPVRLHVLVCFLVVVLVINISVGCYVCGAVGGMCLIVVWL